MSLPPLTFNAWLRYAVIEEALRNLDITKVLDIGAGTAPVGARLATRYEYVGVEPDPISYAKARERLDRLGRGNVLQGDLSALDPDATFDLVCAIAVLEHMADDSAALAEWRERIRPGGWLLISVPAFQHRWGAADELAGHYRRYEPAQLIQLLAKTGYRDARIRMYGFGLGYPLEHVRNLLARHASTTPGKAERTASSGRRFQPPDWLAWFTQLTTAPFRRLQHLAPDRGTGLVVLARRLD